MKFSLQCLATSSLLVVQTSAFTTIHHPLVETRSSLATTQSSSSTTTELGLNAGDKNKKKNYSFDFESYHDDNSNDVTDTKLSSSLIPMILSESSSSSLEEDGSSSKRGFFSSRMFLTTVTGLISGLFGYVARGMAEEDLEYAELPPPYVPAIFGVVLLAGVGILTSSLGDVMDEEASLGLQSGARAKKEIERSRSSYFKKR